MCWSRMALLAALGVAAPALVVWAATTPPEVAVGIDNFTFAPTPLTVAAGSRVVWSNHDGVPHLVVGKDGGGFRSHALDTGDTYAVVFDKAGAYSYFCGLHPQMQGIVVVK